MTRVLGAAFIAAIAASTVSPGVAAGQGVPGDSLIHRIHLLERRAVDLERRVRDLEALITSEFNRVRPVATSMQAEDVQNWRRLRLSMTMDQVRAMLGEPEQVAVTGPWTFWNWNSLGGAHVRFDNRSGKVDAWAEPRS